VPAPQEDSSQVSDSNGKNGAITIKLPSKAAFALLAAFGGIGYTTVDDYFDEREKEQSSKIQASVEKAVFDHFQAQLDAMQAQIDECSSRLPSSEMATSSSGSGVRSMVPHIRPRAPEPTPSAPPSFDEGAIEMYTPKAHLKPPRVKYDDIVKKAQQTGDVDLDEIYEDKFQ